MVRRLDNLEVRRTIRQTLASGLEEVTREYDAACEPHRVALNTVLAAKPHNWHHAAYAVGDRLGGFDFTDEAWPDFPEPSEWDTSEAWSQRIALEIFRAAAARDREQFEYLVGLLKVDPAAEVAAEVAAAAAARHTARVLFERQRNEARGGTVEGARAVFRSVNLDLTLDGLTLLSRVGYHPPPHVEAALAHWVDPGFPGVRVIDGQIAPLGDRRPLWAATARDHGGKTKERGGRPAESEGGEAIYAAVLSVYAGNAPNKTFARIARVVRDQAKTANERLHEIDGLLRIPRLSPAKTLGDMLGVSATAVKNTDWWEVNRKGKKQQEIAGREGRMRERGEVYE